MFEESWDFLKLKEWREKDMEIKVGQYYALESTEEGSTEVNIIKILPNKPNMLNVFVCTETLYIKDGQVCDLYTNDWVKDSIQREATEREIQVFKNTREKMNDLKPYGELVSFEFFKQKKES